MYILKLLVILHLLVSTQIEAGRKIVGGELAKDTKAVPCIVQLAVYREPNVEGKDVLVSGCGGSYIHPNWVISATHCIKSHFPLKNHKPKYDVVLCMGSVEANLECPEPLTRMASELHPYTENPWQKHDIMLLKVLKPWVLSPTIQIAKLPPPKVPRKSYHNKKCLIAGWGRTSDTVPGTKLKKGTVTIFVGTPEECYFDWPGQICVKGDTALTCHGDSGGPLLCDGILVGVLSGGVGECNNTDVSTNIFVMVEAYRDWIVKITGGGANSIVPNKLCLCIFSVIPLTIFN